ncbi:MAG: AAA family ATPase, partial [Elusimicrobia bacterium]|nr:AAA family ATPase [Elusimicrobiota bacterium]
MYFKRLEIFGFKSFGDRTILNFEPGITAIVGPNGCGKSNVFDAIRWVLGEQSAKQLRGSGMEDVIFNGTDTKLALGFAEVSVTFDNSSRTLAVDRDEVVITRRLFRSGESEYLINKETSRLKDITELFMGTGVGAEAYSLVQQGKVDLVVSAKPEERRIIFDEAAGITKYKAKKREAQNKLEETTGNLLRLNDIVVEVKRQIATVERQAQKAQRYKEEFEKLKGMEQVYALHQLREMASEREGIEAFLRDVQSRENDRTRDLEEFRAVIERDSLLQEDLEIKIREAREEALRIDNQIELNSRQIGFNEERLENIVQSEARISEQKKALVEKCRVVQEKIVEIDRMLGTVKTEMDQARQDLEGRHGILSGISAVLEDGQRAIADQEQEVLRCSSRQVEIRNQLTETIKESQGHIGRRRRLDIEQVKALAAKEAAERKIEGISQGMAEVNARRNALLETLDREKAWLAQGHEDLKALELALDKLEKRKFFLISQKDFIEKMEVQDRDAAVAGTEFRFLSPVAPVTGQGGLIGRIKQVVALEGARIDEARRQFPGSTAETFYEIICESKYIDLDPQSLASQIEGIERESADLLSRREVKTAEINDRSQIMARVQADIHAEDKRLFAFEAQKGDAGLEVQKVSEELESVLFE